MYDAILIPLLSLSNFSWAYRYELTPKLRSFHEHMADKRRYLCMAKSLRSYVQVQRAQVVEPKLWHGKNYLMMTFTPDTRHRVFAWSLA